MGIFLQPSKGWIYGGNNLCIFVMLFNLFHVQNPVIMKTYMKYFSFIVLISMTSFVQINVVVAQSNSKITARDHRPKARAAASRPDSRPRTTTRDHRTNPVNSSRVNRSSKKQILFFDEADALFGKRTTISINSASVQFTGKLETIRISKKLGSGDNLVYKMPSGHTLYANVKNSKIFRLNLKGSNRKIINAYPMTEITGFSARKSNGCLSCKRVCVQEYNNLGHPVGPPDCQFICTPVKCNDKRKNGILVGGKAKK